jgi:hypothetical protein
MCPFVATTVYRELTPCVSAAIGTSAVTGAWGRRIHGDGVKHTTGELANGSFPMSCGIIAA